MKLLPYLLLGVAWDNYDRYMCTQNSKNSLHDTVGIVYHDIYVPQRDDGTFEEGLLQATSSMQTSHIVSRKSEEYTRHVA